MRATSLYAFVGFAVIATSFAQSIIDIQPYPETHEQTPKITSVYVPPRRAFDPPKSSFNAGNVQVVEPAFGGQGRYNNRGGSNYGRDQSSGSRYGGPAPPTNYRPPNQKFNAHGPARVQSNRPPYNNRGSSGGFQRRGYGGY